MKHGLKIFVAMCASVACASSALAQVEASDGAARATAMLQATTPLPAMDHIVTGSTTGAAPSGSSTPGAPLGVLCDRDCQLERLERWESILDN